MNERIQEILELAEEYSYQEYARKLTGYTREELFQQKFAELIVRECIKVALDESVPEEEIYKENEIKHVCYLRGNNSGIRDAAIAIKHHFGVEE